MVLFDTVTRQVIATASTVNGTLVTDEPAGVAAETVDGRVKLGFSDDQGKKEIVFTKPITSFTSLQIGSSLRTDSFGNTDPEGIFSIPDDPGDGVTHYLLSNGPKWNFRNYRTICPCRYETSR